MGAAAQPSRSGPRVLVAFASKHGSTEDVAREIAARLASAGCAATHAPVAEIDSLAGFDAFVIGSSVYMGHWLADARAIADRYGAELRAKPVWLFSVGPLGDPPKPEGEPEDARAIALAVGAVEHHIFTGRLDRSMLSFTEKAATRLVGAPEGDFRDWTAIRDWADGIAASLMVQQSMRMESA